MSLYSELKDRKVIRVAAVYLVVAWLLVQVVGILFPMFNFPQWASQFVVILLLIGFPVAMILAWAFDATPTGNTGSVRGKPLAIGLIAVTAIVAGFILSGFGSGFDSGDAEPDEIASSLVEEVAPIAQLEEQGVLPNSVAVLLCDNLSPDPNDAYFAAGIHEEILNQLVKLSKLNVIARTSVMKYAGTDMGIPEIAEELNIGSVMECSVRFAGTSIMVTAQLIDPVTNSHLWSETYPGDISDLSGVFAMQADIAMNIANALHTEFSLEEQAAIEAIPTESDEAYQLYLKARALERLFETPTIVALLDEAIALDPEFGLAHAFKAFAILGRVARQPVSLEQEQLGLLAVEKALQIDPNSEYALIALARHHNRNGRRAEAQEIYFRLLGLYPSSAFVNLQVAGLANQKGDYETAMELYQRAVELDPNTGENFSVLSLAYLRVNLPLDAYVAIQSALDINPNNLIFNWQLMRTYTALGRYQEAADTLAVVGEIWGDRPVRISFSHVEIAMVLALGGNEEELHVSIDELHEAFPESEDGSLARAILYIAINETDMAYDEMKKAVESILQRNGAVRALNQLDIKENIWNHPVLDEPRFVELRNQMPYQ